MAVRNFYRKYNSIDSLSVSFSLEVLGSSSSTKSSFEQEINLRLAMTDDVQF